MNKVLLIVVVLVVTGACSVLSERVRDRDTARIDSIPAMIRYDTVVVAREDCSCCHVTVCGDSRYPKMRIHPLLVKPKRDSGYFSWYQGEEVFSFSYSPWDEYILRTNGVHGLWPGQVNDLLDSLSTDYNLIIPFRDTLRVKHYEDSVAYIFEVRYHLFYICMRTIDAGPDEVLLPSTYEVEQNLGLYERVNSEIRYVIGIDSVSPYSSSDSHHFLNGEEPCVNGIPE